jgi:hypothetical protein
LEALPHLPLNVLKQHQLILPIPENFTSAKPSMFIEEYLLPNILA